MPSPIMSEHQDSQVELQPMKTVTFDEEYSAQDPGKDPETSTRRWTRRGSVQTIESRVFQHAYMIRRPRALLFYNPSISGSSTPVEGKSLSREPSRMSKEPSNISSGSGDSEREERSTDDAIKQYERVDLFIDLIWVGIIANLSGSFGEQAFGENTGVTIGEAVGEFCLLFIPIWRLWDFLREYIGNFYKDDLLDRNFIVWILILSVLYGVNAPFAFTPADEGNSLTLLITIYLIARASFLSAYLIQSIFMPFLWRQFIFQAVSSVLTSSLWIAAIFVPYPGTIALLIVANGLEQPLSFIFASPLGDKLLSGGWKRTNNVDRYVERHEGFFIIILGEGVFRLIEGSPSGIGINSHTGTVLTALLLYYILHWIYFNGDQTKSYVHAVRRTWWKPFLWKLLHIIMFGALLVLAASVVFLVKNNNVNTTGETNGTTPESEVKAATQHAIWSASATLSITLLTMTCVALLHRSLDKPNTLVVNSRWIRLAPRVPAIVLIMCLPLMNLSGSAWCGFACIVIYGVFVWEAYAGLEKDWKWIQTKDEVEDQLCFYRSTLGV